MYPIILREASKLNPVKVGKPSLGGGSWNLHLVFPNLEVGKWFLWGGMGGKGGKDAQDNESFFKFPPLICAFEGQNNMSYREGGG